MLSTSVKNNSKQVQSRKRTKCVGWVISLYKDLFIMFERMQNLGMKMSANTLVLMERYFAQEFQNESYIRDMGVGSDEEMFMD